MSKITMQEVYKRLNETLFDDLEDARANGTEKVMTSFSAFTVGMRERDFIVTESTIKSKWHNAVCDGVIEPVGSKAYRTAFVNVRMLDAKLGYDRPNPKNVCVSVCVSRDPEAPKEVGA